MGRFKYSRILILVYLVTLCLEGGVIEAEGGLVPQPHHGLQFPDRPPIESSKWGTQLRGLNWIGGFGEGFRIRSPHLRRRLQKRAAGAPLPPCSTAHVKGKWKKTLRKGKRVCNRAENWRLGVKAKKGGGGRKSAAAGAARIPAKAALAPSTEPPPE